MTRKLILKKEVKFINLEFFKFLINNELKNLNYNWIL